MTQAEKYFQILKNDKARLTKTRKAMLQCLEEGHLTFKELQVELLKKGYHNVATIYNNLDFFIKQGFVVEINLNGVKYFDLSIDTENDNKGSHIHVALDNVRKITEISGEEIFTLIKEHKSMKNIDVESIRITIVGKSK